LLGRSDGVVIPTDAAWVVQSPGDWEDAMQHSGQSRKGSVGTEGDLGLPWLTHSSS
jgi:hypothetical protein